MFKQSRSSSALQITEKHEDHLKADTGGSIQKVKKESQEIERKLEQDL